MLKLSIMGMVDMFPSYTIHRLLFQILQLQDQLQITHTRLRMVEKTKH
jgi:hypothetical protein